MKIFFNIISIVIIFAAITPAMAQNAAEKKSDCPEGRICLESPITAANLDNGNKKEPITAIQVLLGVIIKAGLGIIGSLALLMMVWGGFLWLTSGGSEERVTQGTQTMLWAVVGLVLVFSSYLILTTFTEYLTGNK